MSNDCPFVLISLFHKYTLQYHATNLELPFTYAFYDELTWMHDFATSCKFGLCLLAYFTFGVSASRVEFRDEYTIHLDTFSIEWRSGE